MRPFKVLFLYLSLLTSALAGADSNIHLPIMGDRASTIGHLRINFDKMPGGQATDSIVLNAVSVGLGSRVEFGVIPWVVAAGNSDFFKYGITLKYNFYKGKNFQWAIGGSQLKAQLKDESNDQDENGVGSDYRVKVNQWWNYQFISVNYTPSNRKFNLGLTLKYTEIISKSSITGNYAYEYDGIRSNYPIFAENTEASYSSTVTFDMNYQLKSYRWLGLALGTASLSSRLNVNESEDSETNESARIRKIIGMSYILRKKISIFDTPRLSVLYFEGDGIQFGFSTFI